MFAPGIPQRREIRRLPTVITPQQWPLTLHDHEAKKAGRHFDLRLGDDRGAHSWALRRWPAPGDKVLAVQQPTHTLAYMSFSGIIGEGYGAGRVSIARHETAEIVHADDDHVRFNLYPRREVEEYLLRRVGQQNWLLLNVTRRREPHIPTSKPAYKTVKEPRADDEGTWQAKIDGAHNILDMTGDSPRVYSFRRGKREDLINHTPKIPALVGARTPPELRGSIFRVELTAHDEGGKALPAAAVGGLLNSATWKSRESAPIVPYLIDVVRWRGKDVANEPWSVKQPLLDAVSLPWLRHPRTATTPAAKKKLLADITAGREPQTREGVVVWHPDKAVPQKAKLVDDVDVYVRAIFPEMRPNLAGGFAYSLTPQGPVVGRVGTGFSHDLKRDMLANSPRYIGLRAKVIAQPTTRGRALRAPVFGGWHLDQRLPEGLKMAGYLLPTAAGGALGAIFGAPKHPQKGESRLSNAIAFGAYGAGAGAAMKALSQPLSFAKKQVKALPIEEPPLSRELRAAINIKKIAPNAQHEHLNLLRREFKNPRSNYDPTQIRRRVVDALGSEEEAENFLKGAAFAAGTVEAFKKSRH